MIAIMFELNVKTEATQHFAQHKIGSRVTNDTYASKAKLVLAGLYSDGLELAFSKKPEKNRVKALKTFSKKNKISVKKKCTKPKKEKKPSVDVKIQNLILSDNNILDEFQIKEEKTNVTVKSRSGREIISTRDTINNYYF